MPVTANLSIPKPDPDAQVDEEFFRLGEAWDLVDAIVAGVLASLAQKAAAVHGHSMADISGLTQALAEKMGIGEIFKLDDLQDVQGATDAATNYILAKTAQGLWVPSSAAAVLGQHQHAVADIVGLTAAIAAQVSALVGSAPATLDTLAEIATALGNNPNFATTMTNSLAAKAPLASPALTGTPTAPTQATTDKSTRIATTAFVQAVVDASEAVLNAAIATKAPLASPALTGNPTAPTQAVGNNSTRIATTAYVLAAIAAEVDAALIGARTAQLAANSVGSYAFARRMDGGDPAFGQTIAGSNLQPSNVNASVSGTMSGTWRCMGYVQPGSSTSGAVALWLRIS